MLALIARPPRLTRILSLAVLPLFALVPLGHHPLARKETGLIGAASALKRDVGQHNTSLPLTISPQLAYSTYLGGSMGDLGYAIAVDGQGNAYVTGTTPSTNFPVANASQGSFGGAQDVFVTKLTASGSVAWSTYLGGSGYDIGHGIAVDGQGNVYVTGTTTSTNFPLAHAAQGSFGGAEDAFVTKLTASGSVAYSTYLGGGSIDGSSSIAVDGQGNAYVTGFTLSTNFPVAHAFQSSFAGGVQDAFVTKLTTSGSLVWSTYLGGNVDDNGYGVAVDGQGNVYVTGGTTSTNFPVVHAFQGSFGGGAYGDAFVTKLTASDSVVWSTYLGGSDYDIGYGLAVDGQGNVDVTGETGSPNFPVAHAAQGSLGGLDDAFVTKLTTSGSLIWSSYLGGSMEDAGLGVAVDGQGNVYVTGQTDSTNFPVPNAFQGSFGGGDYDAFVTKLTTSGSLGWSTYLGGSDTDGGFGIAVDGQGNVSITGQTSSTNFPVANAFQHSPGGSGDAFVTKLAAAGGLQPSVFLPLVRR